MSTTPFAKDSGSIIFLTQIESHEHSTAAVFGRAADVSQFFPFPNSARTVPEAFPNHPAEPEHLEHVPQSISTYVFPQSLYDSPR
jgi:hypothetical protein